MRVILIMWLKEVLCVITRLTAFTPLLQNHLEYLDVALKYFKCLLNTWMHQV